MNKEKLLAQFAKKLQAKIETDGIQFTNVLSSAAEDVISAQLTFAEDEIQNSYECPKKYVQVIPRKIKKEASIHGGDLGWRKQFKSSKVFFSQKHRKLLVKKLQRWSEQSY